MLDVKLDARESKIRTFICQHYDIYNKMLLIKQADFSACKDNLSVAPTILKWQKIYNQMLNEKVPFSLGELNINGTDLIKLGFTGKKIGEVLNELWLMAILTPTINTNQKLIEIATKRLKN
jgi:tRNA nucleotidyltransferase (CCA-adding enzyme)